MYAMEKDNFFTASSRWHGRGWPTAIQMCRHVERHKREVHQGGIPCPPLKMVRVLFIYMALWY